MSKESDPVRGKALGFDIHHSTKQVTLLYLV